MASCVDAFVWHTGPSDVLERVTAIIPSSAEQMLNALRNAERKQKSELPFLLIRARGTVLRVLIDCLPRRWPYALSVLFYKFGQSVSDLLIRNWKVTD
jgi:hypothetical protein